jgi:hypothetical protein
LLDVVVSTHPITRDALYVRFYALAGARRL